MRRTLSLAVAVLLAGCGYSGMGPGGSAWGPGPFDSLGEQIYFTSLGENGAPIRYRGGTLGGMMMGSYLACASCHGPDARGGRHIMHMRVMAAPDIRWSALQAEAGDDHSEDGHHQTPYDVDTFRRAVVDGEHPDGESLSRDMPRWHMTQEELEALAAYLQSLP